MNTSNSIICPKPPRENTTSFKANDCLMVAPSRTTWLSSKIKSSGRYLPVSMLRKSSRKFSSGTWVRKPKRPKFKPMMGTLNGAILRATDKKVPSPPMTITKWHKRPKSALLANSHCSKRGKPSSSGRLSSSKNTCKPSSSKVCTILDNGSNAWGVSRRQTMPMR